MLEVREGLTPLALLEHSSASDFVTSSTWKKKKKKGEKDTVKLRYLKNTSVLASHGQNELNSDAKLFSAKLHESIIRSHFISVLQIYCRDALSYFHSKKHSHYNPLPFFKDFNSFPYAHDAAAWHTNSLVQM